MRQDRRKTEELVQSDDADSTLTVRSGLKKYAKTSARPHWLLALYQSLFTALLPIYLLVKLIRGWLKDKHIKELTILDQYAQSLGFRLPPVSPKTKGLIWIHAVSLGELNTVKPLIDQLLARDYPLLITNTTATGYWRTQGLYGGQVLHCPMVVDQPSAVRRFLKHFSPAHLVLVETEIWPALLDSAYQNNLPVTLINARMTLRSASRLQQAPKLSRYLFSGLDLILCQDSLSVKRFIELGADPNRVKSCTNLKFLSALSSSVTPLNCTDQFAADGALEPELNADKTDLKSRPNTAFILTAASTHDPEERMILEVFERLQAATTQSLMLILVPRHPERFDEVARLLSQKSVTFCRRSHGHTPGHTPVFLADTLGELERWYAMSDLSFVGGSIASIGGHTPMEAAKYAVPVVMGRHTHKCQDMVEVLLEVGALVQAQTVDELFAVCQAAINAPNEFKDKGARGQAMLERLARDAQKQIDALIDLIEAR